MSKVLLTGGLGYIGSHTCTALTQSGYGVVIVDSLLNAKASVLDRLRTITGADIEFHQLDVRDQQALGRVFSKTRIATVIHFAGLKAVEESVKKPLLYYDNNVGGAMALLQVMAEHAVQRIVFSSSATVYGEPEKLPITENHPLRPQNPYGTTKLVVEGLLADCSRAQPDFRYAALRYFNPIGAHPSGQIGEDPQETPNNLLPYIAQVAVGRRAKLRVFGNDYATPDGTGVRDYIHVMDLARGHVDALRYLEKTGSSTIVNLGTGRGYSVLEVVKAFEQASGKRVPLEMVARRAGDIAACYADASLAKVQLGWGPANGLDAMCTDTWRWQSQNPNGYPG
jgi:UDP-glucose 4-epimerase